MTHPAPHRVIYDTDPGVDDAMALYYALAHPDIEVVGVTTTFGNVTVEQAAINALYLLAIAGRSEIPVTQGVAAPMVKRGEAPPDHIHGADGLGNLPQRQATHTQLDARSSAQFIVEMARQQPGQITVVAVGPLGNLALALAIEPQLPRLLRQVFTMGGAVLEPGNVSPVAEANIWNDPHAADVVFTAGFDLTMVGLDVTHQVILPVSLFAQIARHHRHPATDTLHHAVAFYADFYSGLYPHVAEIHGCFGHDVLAFVALTNPGLFSTETGRVRVAVDGLAQGQTMLRRKSIAYPQSGWGPEVPDSQVCITVQAPECKALIERTLMGAWLGGLNMNTNPHLPVLDFHAPDAPLAFCRSLHKTGFAVLRNHPLPQSLVEGIYAEWRAFFAQDAKHAYAFDPATGDGYFSTDVSETAKGEKQRDLKEFFHVFPWGRYPTEVSGAARGYYAQASALAATLLGWVQAHTPSDVLSRFSMPLPQMLQNSDHTLLRVLHYPPLAGDEAPQAVRAAAHTDINLLTLLPAATAPGLQIRAPDGGWIDVPCDFGLLIVNIGDMLQEASGHYYPSTVHRVLNPTGPERTKSRVSLPLFLHPRREVVLSARYTVGSYFDERMRELRALDP